MVLLVKVIRSLKEIRQASLDEKPAVWQKLSNNQNYLSTWTKVSTYRLILQEIDNQHINILPFSVPST